jgi:hypothetical protein
MTRAKRTSNEQYSLDVAKPLLKEIYGDFEFNNDVNDKPDAEIILNNGKVIGIEIVQLDNREYLYHTNKRIKQFSNEAKNTSDNYFKEATIRVKFFPELIAERVCINKNPKYKNYQKNGKYEEVILLMSSEIIDLNDYPKTNFYSDHMMYALEKQLKLKNIFYDKTILVSLLSSKSTLVSQKGKNIRMRQSNFNSSDWRKGNHYVDLSRAIIKANESMTVELNFQLTKSMPA